MVCISSKLKRHKRNNIKTCVLHSFEFSLKFKTKNRNLVDTERNCILISLRACVLSCFSPVRLFVTDSVDCSPPGSCVHGILQARILKCVVKPFSRRTFQSKDRTLVSLCIWHWRVASLPLVPPGQPL